MLKLGDQLSRDFAIPMAQISKVFGFFFSKKKRFPSPLKIAFLCFDD
jgi:hypothetical protein